MASPSLPIRVFLCGTYADIRDERDAVLTAIEHLGCERDSMELFGAHPEQPIDVCLDEVRKSDILVVVVAHRYGSMVPNLSISYTEAEYQEGFAHAKPCLVYIKSDDAQVSVRDVESDPLKIQLLKSFRSTLRNRHTCFEYDEPTSLGVRVAADLSRMNNKLNGSSASLTNSTPSQVDKPNASDTLASVLATNTVRVGFFRFPPFIDYFENNGNIVPSGLFGEMFKSVAQKHSLAMSCIPLNVGDAIGAIEDGSVDLILGVFQTPERSKRVDFSALLYSFKIGGIALASLQSVRAIGDLQRDDVKIAVCKGEVGHEWAANTLRIPKRRLKVLDSHSLDEVVNVVESGVADVALSAFVTLKQYLQQRNETRPRLRLMFQRDPVTVCAEGVMVARGQDAWADWLDTQLKSAREHPRIRELERLALSSFPNVVQRY